MKQPRLLTRTLVLLALTIGGLGLPRPAAAQAPSTEALYVMDREAYLRTTDTRLVRTTYDLRNGPNLAAFPMQLGDWVGQELPITNLETFPTLDADNIVYRGYVRDADGGMVIFSLVGGRRCQRPAATWSCGTWSALTRRGRGSST
jgi:hypothetical protein